MTKTFRSQRLGLGLTQQELAEMCGEAGAPVSDVTISAIERGLWAPRPKPRAVLCKILDLPIGYFDKKRIRTTPPATWTCDKCGQINSDGHVTCWKCGA